MFFLAPYATQTIFTFPMIKRGVTDFAVTADWTPATGDTKISKDGGSDANTTNNPGTPVGVKWPLTLTASELTCAVADVAIVDSATKAVEDQFLKIYTYGHASAKIPFDLGNTKLAALLNRASVGTVATAGFTPTATEFECSDITEVTGNHYLGQAVYATSGNLAGQCLGVVTAYTLTGGRGHFTVTPGSPTGEALANTNTVLIV